MKEKIDKVFSIIITIVLVAFFVSLILDIPIISDIGAISIYSFLVLMAVLMVIGIIFSIIATKDFAVLMGLLIFIFLYWFFQIR